MELNMYKLIKIKEDAKEFQSRPKTSKQLSDAWVLAKCQRDKHKQKSDEYIYLDKFMKYLVKWKNAIPKAKPILTAIEQYIQDNKDR